MGLLTGQTLGGQTSRTYHVHVPDDPPAERVPVVVVFHGGGQDATTIARRWGVDPPAPVPPGLASYLLVFPEADPGLGDAWMHVTAGDTATPTHDLAFVAALLDELTTASFSTSSATVPTVTGDPDHVYAAGFSNGGGMVWQLAHSALVARFRGFAAVGKALDPEKVRRYSRGLGGAPAVPVPVMYVHGTGDVGFRPPFSLHETPLDTTLPSFTVQAMADRNGFALDVPAATRLLGGTVNLTEVVVQLFAGVEAFAMATVLHGGHNWPTPTTRGNPPVATHFDATAAVVDFWHRHAGLP
ncbi:hypothetical protein ICW40_10340 [Actinotalea ferrariae]|uniref:alpha/beta hydrolase family esterase n=1 Tax=Actinotalea ferrariae TaxID=1386098 RepID=UPI001C8C08EE|nr:hypothetical protein [Actinotalea ferrariae]MBX9245205.1 hypothetical protein [Actinotalea ferrariae]